MAKWLDVVTAARADLEMEVSRLREENAKLGRALNVARYGHPDFSWEVHKSAMSDLQEENAKLRKVDEWRCEQLRKAQERIRAAEAERDEWRGKFANNLRAFPPIIARSGE